MKSNTLIPFSKGSLPTFFEDFFGPVRGAAEAWSPSPVFPVDIKETSTSYRVVANLPGVAKKDVDINLKDGVLSIAVRFGESSVSPENDQNGEAEYRLIRNERYEGGCERRFRLPREIERSKVEAELVDGILAITVRKPDPEVQKAASRIEIN